MAAAIPFVTIEEAIASLSKIDVRKKTPIHFTPESIRPALCAHFWLWTEAFCSFRIYHVAALLSALCR